MAKKLSEKDLLWIDEKVKSMTLDEKIAQITCLAFKQVLFEAGKKKSKLTFEQYAQIIDEYMNKYPVGNVFFGSEVVKLEDGNAERAHFIISYLQSKADIPMLICGDVESGVGSAVKGLTTLTNSYSLGVADDVEISYKYGEIIAKGSKAIGYNWAFTPVVDVPRNWLNDAGGRRLSSKTDRILKHSGALMKGLQDNDMAACLKHFPGFNGYVNTHIGTDLNTLSKEEWMANEGKIYKSLCDEGALSVMAAHSALKWAQTYDEKDDCYAPSSCSGEVIDGVLRNTLGFDGVVVTDGTGMAAYKNWKTRRERIVSLYNGGIDMILNVSPLDIQYIRETVASGEIPMEKIDKSVRRVLTMKMQLDLFNWVDTYSELDKIEEETKELRKLLETKCVTCVKDHHKLLPLSKEKIKRALVLRLDENSSACAEFVEQLKEYKIDVDVYTNEDFADWDEIPRLEKQVMAGETWDAYFILFAKGFTVGDYRPDGGAAISLWRSAGLVEGVEPILVSFSSPHLLKDMPHIKTFVATFGNNDGNVPKYTAQAIFGDAELNSCENYSELL